MVVAQYLGAEESRGLYLSRRRKRPTRCEFDPDSFDQLGNMCVPVGHTLLSANIGVAPNNYAVFDNPG